MSDKPKIVWQGKEWEITGEERPCRKGEWVLDDACVFKATAGDSLDPTPCVILRPLFDEFPPKPSYVVFEPVSSGDGNCCIKCGLMAWVSCYPCERNVHRLSEEEVEKFLRPPLGSAENPFTTDAQDDPGPPERGEWKEGKP